MSCKFFNSGPHRSGWCNSDYTLMKCKFCKYYRTGFCKCEPNVRCQWRYADKAKGMISDE